MELGNHAEFLDAANRTMLELKSHKYFLGIATVSTCQSNHAGIEIQIIQGSQNFVINCCQSNHAGIEIKD